MVFSSLVFLCIFLPVTFILYHLVRSIPAKNAILIIASLLFYAYGEPIYVLLMLASTLMNYGFGLAIGNKKSKGLLAGAVALNLGLLGVFKYTAMLVTTVNQITGAGIPVPQIALPIGISFYTFQAMSYVIDVYRRDVKAQKNYAKVLLYISFFPQLIAGPIVKYHDIEAAIEDRSTDLAQIASGIRRFIIGLSKKVLISNVVALAADKVFAMDMNGVNIWAAWIGAVTYMLQIYYDFSGYSDMAIGLGQIFGFRFQENFRHPYSARTIQEFWRRWHISLSTWFKEYLYIPLGGNRKGTARTLLNRMIVFFCTGLWHGANWTFVFWGLYHGAFLIFETFVPMKKLPRVLGNLYTALVVCIGFIFFRADTLTQGGLMVAKMFGGFRPETVSMEAIQVLTPLLIAIVVIAVIGAFPWLDALVRNYMTVQTGGFSHSRSDAGSEEAADSDRNDRKNDKADNRAVLLPAADTAGYVLAMLLFVLCLLSLSSGTYNPFIYFRF